GRRRCTGRDRDGDRARRALRIGAAASVARARGARIGREFLSAAARGVGERRGAAAVGVAARHGGWVPDRGRGFPAAWWRRNSWYETVRTAGVPAGRSDRA